MPVLDSVQMKFPSADTSQKQYSVQNFAEFALKTAAGVWFVVAVTGQMVFAFSVASFYGSAAVRGHLESWNRFMTHGYISGDSLGNFALAMHLSSAVLVLAAGAIQLVPQIRVRFPAFHRWNGRIYMLAGFTIGIAGLYMIWIRGSVGDFSQHIGASLNVVLIMLCAAMALRYAVARDFKTHRRWALRLFLVMSGNFFLRAGFFLSLFLFKGPVGFDPITFTGPFLTFLAFAQYLLPLAVLELYLRAQERSGAPGRIATAAGLFVLTLAMGVGMFGVATTVWLPTIKAAYDDRKSIAETLSATMTASGIEEAAKQYHAFKPAEPTTYNFDERELNNLGYQLIRANKFKDAIRVFQLNVEAYPQSGNTYDSLAEAYMDDGNKPQAIANYQKSLQLNPNNRNALLTLQKLKAP
jgi:hypothetical protein